ncbi:MAG: putative rane protein [Myxococcaceae bacterium]|nr:putative rane protein [Myxococcaceae bacterium]
MTFRVLAENAGLVLLMMTGLWAVSVARRDAGVVDPWWSIGFLLITARTAASTGLTPAKTLLLAMVGAWALRLWLHLLLRSRGRPEDPRYAAFRQRFGAARYWWVSFFQVFLLQGALLVFISAPLQLAAVAREPDPIGLPHLAGLLLFGIGFLLEAVADAQLQSFRTDPARRGAVLDTGLWRFSRHPNYFGEALLWWGFWLCALGQPWGWATIFAPLMMTFLLVKVSGVSMLDAHLTATRPGYRAYLLRTSAFVPLPPRPQ